MTARKRYRARMAKPGELIAYYGKLPHDAPDVMFSWGGDGAYKRDAALVQAYLCSDRPSYCISHGKQEIMPSLVRQLEERGYDITTLKFSIKKKGQS